MATATVPTTSSAMLGLKVTGASSLHDMLLAGLPYKALVKFETESGLGPKAVMAVVDIPLRTLARRKKSGKLSLEESERLHRLARVVEAAVELFEGDRAAAVHWLQSPRAALRGRTPLSMTRTEVGATEVLHLIGRLEHGVFS